MNASIPSSRLSVGVPSVSRNTSGFQSPFWVGVEVRTSFFMQSARTVSAPPRAVAPPAVSSGSLKSMSSVRGDICRAVLLNVMTERHAVSRACGSPFSSLRSALIPCFTASIGSPDMEPEQSSSRYTGSLLM